MLGTQFVGLWSPWMGGGGVVMDDPERTHELRDQYVGRRASLKRK